MMPSTSVQIHSSAASSAAARMEAEKSEPPRPRVVGRPSAVAPLKPVTTGISERSSRGSRRARAFSRVASMSGEALPKTASVTTTSQALTAAAGTPSAFRWSATRSAESRSPTATASSTERGGRSLSMAMPRTMRSNSPISSSICASTSGWRAAGSSSRQASSWRRRSSARLVCMPAAVAAFGVAHGIEQQVGDLRHGRDHHGDGTPGALGGGQAGGGPHALGRAHAGAAEFHDQQILQRNSPLFWLRLQPRLGP